MCCVEAVACDCVVTHSVLHPSVFGATFRADLFSLFTLVCVFVVAFVRACAHMMRTAHRRSLVRWFVCAGSSSHSNRAETSRLVAQHQTNVIDRLRDVTLELLTSLHVSAHTPRLFFLIRSSPSCFSCLHQSDFLPGRDTQHDDLFPSKTTRMFLVFAQLFKRLLVYAISRSQLQQSSAFLFLYKISLDGAMFCGRVVFLHRRADSR